LKLKLKAAAFVLASYVAIVMLDMKNPLKGIFTAAITDLRSQMYTRNVLLYVYIYIQGVTGGTDQTSGGCSLC